jgi:RNA-directed DNA polymerase
VVGRGSVPSAQAGLDKTRLIEFGRHAAERRARRDLDKPETFNFLGFTHICGRSRRGRFLLKRKTRRDRMRTTLRALKSELRQCMHQPLHEQGTWLGQVVRGYFAYHAVPTNADRLNAFRHDVVALWRRALRRRSQKDGTTWSRIERLSAEFIPMPRILHPWPDRRFLVKHPRWEPSARIGPARFYAGGA